MQWYLGLLLLLMYQNIDGRHLLKTIGKEGLQNHQLFSSIVFYKHLSEV